MQGTVFGMRRGWAAWAGLVGGVVIAAMVLSAWAAETLPGAAAPEADHEAVVKEASNLPVTFDGHVSKFEYSDATHVTFPNGHGVVDAYVKCQDGFLYCAFQIPDLSPFPGDDIVVMLDTKHAEDAAPAPGDIRAYVRRKLENSRMYQGKDGKWADYYGDWEWRTALYTTGWEIETRIPLKTLGVDFSKKVTMGLAFRIWDNQPQKVWNWPVGSNEEKPNSWGRLVFQAAQ